ncbi:low temperature requirement protein A [Nocardia vinacea]|uniref:low temperature requirement protein A n=1 Tax=Nocardia vinacea TaxID=96468 RepID=UPI003AF22195
MPGAQRFRVTTIAEDASVTHLELFFDLVIVFAFTMVTDMAAHETTAINLLRAVMTWRSSFRSIDQVLRALLNRAAIAHRPYRPQ